MSVFNDYYKEMNELLDKMKEENFSLSSELSSKREATLNQVFDDIEVINQFIQDARFDSMTLNTGVVFNNKEIHFRISRGYDFITVYTRWVRMTSDSSYCHGRIERGKSLDTYDYQRRELVNYIQAVLDNWGVAFENMKEDMELQGQRIMTQCVKSERDKYEKLQKELNTGKGEITYA